MQGKPPFSAPRKSFLTNLFQHLSSSEEPEEKEQPALTTSDDEDEKKVIALSESEFSKLTQSEIPPTQSQPISIKTSMDKSLEDSLTSSEPLSKSFGSGGSFTEKLSSDTLSKSAGYTHRSTSRRSKPDNRPLRTKDQQTVIDNFAQDVIKFMAAPLTIVNKGEKTILEGSGCTIISIDPKKVGKESEIKGLIITFKSDQASFFAFKLIDLEIPYDRTAFGNSIFLDVPTIDRLQKALHPEDLSTYTGAELFAALNTKRPERSSTREGRK